MKKYTLHLLLFHAFILVLSSCQAQKKDFDKVVYGYQDSSVPPRHHRSYDIVWYESGKGSVSVDVYGDTIAKQGFEVKAEDFERLKALAKNIQGAGTKTSNASGTSHQLIQLFRQNKKVYSRYWDNLQKESEATESFVEFIKNKTPNLQKLINTPYKPQVEPPKKKSLPAQAKYTQLHTLKKKLKAVKTIEEEKEVLQKIWQISREHIEIVAGKEPTHIFHLQMKERKDKSEPVAFKVYAEKFDAPDGASWDERVDWQVAFQHQIIDEANYQILLNE